MFLCLVTLRLEQDRTFNDTDLIYQFEIDLRVSILMTYKNTEQLRERVAYFSEQSDALDFVVIKAILL